MRRTVATLLVVASPLLMVAPVGAAEARVTGPLSPPSAPAVVVAPAPVTLAPPAEAAPVSLALPAVPAPTAAAGALLPPAAARTLKGVRASARHAAADVGDAAYAARLQAELCMARAVFCGLDRGGRYPAG